MNRNQRRRAQAVGVTLPSKGAAPQLDLGTMMATFGRLQEFAELAERVKPFLNTIDQLSSRLDEASDALAGAKHESVELRAALEQQRQVFLRLCAQGMGITVEQVLSMEADIREQLSTENRSDADTSPGPEHAADQASHSGS